MAPTMQYTAEYRNLPKCIDIQYYQLCAKCMTNGKPCFETDLSNMIINFRWQPDSYVKKKNINTKFIHTAYCRDIVSSVQAEFLKMPVTLVVLLTVKPTFHQEFYF